MAGTAARGTARPTAASRGFSSFASARTPPLKPDSKSDTRLKDHNTPGEQQHPKPLALRRDPHGPDFHAPAAIPGCNG